MVDRLPLDALHLISMADTMAVQQFLIGTSYYHGAGFITVLGSYARVFLRILIIFALHRLIDA